MLQGLRASCHGYRDERILSNVASSKGSIALTAVVVFRVRTGIRRESNSIRTFGSLVELKVRNCPGTRSGRHQF